MEYVRFTLKINEKLDNDLKKICKEISISKNNLINLIIEKEIEKIEKGVKNERVKNF